MNNKAKLIKRYTEKMDESLNKLLEADFGCYGVIECKDCPFSQGNNIKDTQCGYIGNAKNWTFDDIENPKERIKELQRQFREHFKVNHTNTQPEPDNVFKTSMAAYMHEVRKLVAWAEDHYNGGDDSVVGYNRKNDILTRLDLNQTMKAGTAAVFDLKNPSDMKFLAKKMLDDLNSDIECIASDWKANPARLEDLFLWRKNIMESTHLQALINGKEFEIIETP
ncbi:MAG: hypothetical protein ACRDCE_00925, partial [Cetobacterium sp.]|uniref:hypothetical protein n=1 Tax=Cetobacterium sp. TaxID=2071632 RepID=UPI003EE58F75